MEKERKKLRKEEIFKTPYSAYYVLYYLSLIKRAFSQVAKMGCCIYIILSLLPHVLAVGQNEETRTLLALTWLKP